MQLISRNEKDELIISNISANSEQKNDLINSSDNIFELNNLSGYWDLKDGKAVIKNINLQAKRGDYIGIVGQVGSGKSSLLNVFL